MVHQAVCLAGSTTWFLSIEHSFRFLVLHPKLLIMLHTALIRALCSPVWVIMLMHVSE